MTIPQNNIERLLGEAAQRLGTHTHDCGYFDDRKATEDAWLLRQLGPDSYAVLMDNGFRRSGQIIYRPVCVDCKLCVPIRISASEFSSSRSQRKALNRNTDVQMSVGEPQLTKEKHDVYVRYLDAQHSKTPQGDDIESMADFLYTSCLPTIEVCYRDSHGKLLGVSILDVSTDVVSSVYHYFDPSEKCRSMGVFSAVREILLTEKLNRKWYYLGFWIKGCKAMEYKGDYRPFELLIDGQWQPESAD